MVLIKRSRDCKERKKGLATIYIVLLIASGAAVIVCTFLSQEINVIKRDKENFLLHQEAKQQFRCRGWHTTKAFHPFNLFRLVRYFKHQYLGRPAIGCHDNIPGDESGYCEVVSTKTGTMSAPYMQHYEEATFNLEQLKEPFFQCAMAEEWLNLLHEASNWQTEEENVSYDTNTSSNRGIVMTIDRASLAAVYASIQLLRKDHSCRLPIELWMNGGEDGVQDSIFDHAILKRILEDPSIKINLHWEWRFDGVTTLIYGAVHSSFDDILLLDKGVFLMKDPSSLFDDPQYRRKGCLFWRSKWLSSGRENGKLLSYLLNQRPSFDNVHIETGQMLVSRKRHSKALRLLLYMLGHFPKTLKEVATAEAITGLIPVVWQLYETELGIVDTRHSPFGVP